MNVVGEIRRRRHAVPREGLQHKFLFSETMWCIQPTIHTMIGRTRGELHSTELWYYL